MKIYNLTQVRDIEYIVCQNAKKYRIKLGISQRIVALTLGVSIQQIQKYENNINRISSGKLYKIAHLFNISLKNFFDEN